jgi:chaperonin cofactor prefoldin
MPEVNVRYMNTNSGRLIETVNGSWLELDQDQPPYKQVGRNMIIRVQDNALVALTRDAEAIPFARVTASATCHVVRDRPRPA